LTAVHFRLFRSLSVALVTSFLLLGLSPIAGAAGEKDKEATKLFEQAMNEDYLNTNFAKAEKKLRDALKRCGADGCSAGVVGKIHVALGTIYGVGMTKLDAAKEEFVAALKADPNAVLDESLSNADLAKAWSDAKKGAGAGKPTEEPSSEKPVKKPAAGGGDPATHTAPTEQVVNTPVPLYIEAAEEGPLSKVTLRYRPFGAKQYKSLELKKLGKGFGGEIPCEDVSTTGEVRYFFALFDENGEAAGTLGSTKDPYKLTIKRDIEGVPPALPGLKPPEQCKEKADCPPGLPGCPAARGGKRGDRGWGASCEETQQCEAGLICKDGSCEEGKDDGSDDASKSKVKRNMIGIGGQLDLLYLSTKADVCSDTTGAYACFLQGKSTQYGNPLKATGTNGISSGLNLASVRLMASFDRHLFRGFPLSAGVRLGWAFGGSPSPDNADEVAAAKQFPVARSYLPLHAEGRVAYHLLGDSLLERLQLRPYVFLSIGLAQANGSVRVTVCNPTTEPGAKTDCSGVTNKMQEAQGVKTTVDAYQIAGLNFFGVGGGTTFGITPNFGVALEVKAMVMFSTVGFVLAPTLGPVYAF
jgi:hypothetical protein